MRKCFSAILCILLVLLCGAAFAAVGTTDFALEPIGATVTLSDSYIALFPSNFAQHPEILSARNTTEEALLADWTGGPSAFFRRALWEKHGGFDTDLKYVMDIELWTRWAKAGEKFAALGDYVWGFREHGGSKTGSGANRDAQLDECARVDARHGVSSGGFWRNVTRAASVLDGSWSKRCADGRRLKGMLWGEVKS